MIGLITLMIAALVIDFIKLFGMFGNEGIHSVGPSISTQQCIIM